MLPQSLVAQTDAALIDPVTGKPGYGKWKTLVASLLEQWLEGKVPGITPQPFRADFDDLLGGSDGTGTADSDRSRDRRG